jgi:hypothetical protein
VCGFATGVHEIRIARSAQETICALSVGAVVFVLAFKRQLLIAALAVRLVRRLALLCLPTNRP